MCILEPILYQKVFLWLHVFCLVVMVSVVLWKYDFGISKMLSAVNSPSNPLVNVIYSYTHMPGIRYNSTSPFPFHWYNPDLNAENEPFPMFALDLCMLEDRFISRVSLK